MVRTATLALALMAIPLTCAAKEPLWCGFDKRYQCGPGGPCKEFADDETAIILDEDNNLYRRCDKKGCTDASMVVSGDSEKYRTFEMPSRGGFGKLGPKGDFSEAVSLASMMLVSYGHCFPESALGK